MRLPLLRFVIARCVAVSLMSTACLAADVKTVAAAVDAHYNHLHSLQTEFTEVYRGSGMDRTETGTLWLKKPGKMRWAYRSPEEKLFVSDGKSAWLYLPAQKQVRRSSLKSLDDLRSPLAFLLGKTKLEKELQNLTFAPEIQGWQSGNAILRGVPRGLENTVREVLVEITPRSQIARLRIQATDDSVTEYRFSNQKEGIALQDASFHFSVPQGVETIEQQPEQ